MLYNPSECMGFVIHTQCSIARSENNEIYINTKLHLFQCIWNRTPPRSALRRGSSYSPTSLTSVSPQEPPTSPAGCWSLYWPWLSSVPCPLSVEAGISRYRNYGQSMFSDNLFLFWKSNSNISQGHIPVVHVHCHLSRVFVRRGGHFSVTDTLCFWALFST